MKVSELRINEITGVQNTPSMISSERLTMWKFRIRQSCSWQWHNRARSTCENIGCHWTGFLFSLSYEPTCFSSTKEEERVFSLGGNAWNAWNAWFESSILLAWSFHSNRIQEFKTSRIFSIFLYTPPSCRVCFIFWAHIPCGNNPEEIHSYLLLNCTVSSSLRIADVFSGVIAHFSIQLVFVGGTIRMSYQVGKIFFSFDFQSSWDIISSKKIF